MATINCGSHGWLCLLRDAHDVLNIRTVVLPSGVVTSRRRANATTTARLRGHKHRWEWWARRAWRWAWHCEPDQTEINVVVETLRSEIGSGPIRYSKLKTKKRPPRQPLLLKALPIEQPQITSPPSSRPSPPPVVRAAWAEDEWPRRPMRRVVTRTRETRGFEEGAMAEHHLTIDVSLEGLPENEGPFSPGPLPALKWDRIYKRPRGRWMQNNEKERRVA